MRCRFCHFEFQRAGNYYRHLRKNHPESAAVSGAAHEQPVGDHEETPHPYPNSTVPVITQKRGRFVSLVLEDIPSKFPKRYAETSALLSGCLSHSEAGSRSSRPDVEPEGGKRLQNIKERREKIQSSDFWNPALDPDTPGEQAVPHSEGSRPVAEYLPAEYEAGKIVAVRALDDLQRLQLNPIFLFQSVPEYKLARFFHESKTSLINIDRFFKANVLPNTHGIHFRSGYT